MLLLLLVAYDLDLTIARKQARLITAENEVWHHLAEGPAVRRRARVVCAQKSERTVDGRVPPILLLDGDRTPFCCRCLGFDDACQHVLMCWAQDAVELSLRLQAAELGLQVLQH